jgi:uncharacterized membrane protein YkoI
MRIARQMLLALLGLTVLAPVGGAQQLIEKRPREQHYIEPRGVSLDQAVQMAQRRYGARAVKAETVSQGDRRVHRIRLMSPEGKVWHVHVDAATGDMM